MRIILHPYIYAYHRPCNEHNNEHWPLFLGWLMASGAPPLMFCYLQLGYYVGLPSVPMRYRGRYRIRKSPRCAAYPSPRQCQFGNAAIPQWCDELVYVSLANVWQWPSPIILCNLSSAPGSSLVMVLDIIINSVFMNCIRWYFLFWCFNSLSPLSYYGISGSNRLSGCGGV